MKKTKPKGIAAPVYLDDARPAGANHTAWLPITVLLCLFGVIVIRRAWLSDDAFITFRTVDNFAQGFGPTWNVAERVQAYTHPLWFLLLSLVYVPLQHGIGYLGLFLNIALSLATAGLFAWKVARSPIAAVFGIAVMSLSQAFVDYSTSGLENPLTHLLLVVFFAIYFNARPSPRTILLLSVTMALAAVNRLDTALLYLPVLIYAVLRVRSLQSVKAALLGQIPLLLWLLFATFYYGTPFPNTAYAKLNLGIPRLALIEQGVYYLMNSLEFDPLTLVIVIAAVAVAIVTRDKDLIFIAVGILAYVGYLAFVGGDFMSGRLLTAPLLAAVVILARCDFASLQPVYLALLFTVVIGLGVSVPCSTLCLQQSYSSPLEFIDQRGIADERQYYFDGTSLFSKSRNRAFPDHKFRSQGLQAKAEHKKVVVQDAVGMFGFYAGPDVHIVDKYALADPLLARLPVQDPERWRIGHFARAIPEGYLATLETGENRLADPSLAKYYDKLSLITRGQLFSLDRLVEIWRLNTGQYEHLLSQAQTSS